MWWSVGNAKSNGNSTPKMTWKQVLLSGYVAFRGFGLTVVSREWRTGRRKYKLAFNL